MSCRRPPGVAAIGYRTGVTSTTALKGSALRALFRLPPPALARLAGAPVTRRHRTLDPQMRLLLTLQALEGPAAESVPIPQGRRIIRDGAAAVGGRLPIGSVHDRTIDGPGGPLPLRVYAPRGVTGTAPALVFFHGGGWIYGDLESHDATCRFLAEQAGVRVVAVDYRLAPEHPFPAAHEDCLAAYDWVLAHADALGIDRHRVAVGGDSAGGNLATVVAQQVVARTEQPAGVVPPAYQLLIYPVVDFVETRPSRTEMATGFFLTGDFVDLASDCYTASGPDPADPLLSPLYGKLEELPPAYVVTAGFDPLLDEGEAYAEAMRAAGVEVTYVCEDGLIHSFANMVALGTVAPAAMRRAARALRRGLHGS